MSNIVDRLTDVVGTDRILSSSTISERVTSFWNDTPMRGTALVFPQTTEEVARILECCNRENQPVITHGGLTNCVA
ncbi:MAG: FAD-binding oxidoreductase, partial [Gammaproteobacteria bacterium]|nr:FAD-binding oxidoreductase [Gammaproteobacteria bacterium]